LNDRSRSEVLADGAVVQYSGTGGPAEEVRIRGVLTKPLQVRVLNKGIFPTTVIFNYSFSSVRNCSESAVEGCGEMDPFAVQRTVVDWSAWAVAKYNTSHKAWQELAGPMEQSIKGHGHAGQGVPLHKWSYVWNAWPHAAGKGTAWQEVFHFISGGGEFVTEPQFASAFALARVSAAAKACMLRLRAHQANRTEAWAALRHHGAEAESMLRNCSEDMRVNASSMMDFLEGVDGKQGFSKDEFDAAWDEVEVCPASFYRSSPIVYHCHRSSGRANFLMRARLTETVTDIPKGAVNLHVGVSSNQDVDLMLWDEATQTWVVKWEGGVVSANQLVGNYQGAEISFSGDESDPPVVEEFVQVEGTLPSRLQVQVNNFASREAAAVVEYSWDRIEGCPAVPEGCLPFNESRAKLGARGYSAWLAKTYASERSAWNGVCKKLAEKYYDQQKETGLDGYVSRYGVPFFEWQEVWQAWPKHETAASTWQEVFHMVDEDGSGLVDQVEFGRLYRKHDSLATMEHFFADVRKTFLESQDACEAMAGDGASDISRERWSTVIADFADGGLLPGGLRVCRPRDPTPRSTFEFLRPFRFGKNDGEEAMKVGLAEAKGLVGKSFTAVARIWRGKPQEDKSDVFERPSSKGSTSEPFDCEAGYSNWEAGWSNGKKVWCCENKHVACSSEPFDCSAGYSNWQAGWSLAKKKWCCANKVMACQPENLNVAVLHTPKADESAFQNGSALFMGLRGGNLAMAFGASDCQADDNVPLHAWTTVAWVYDAKANEQRLVVDGKSVKVCQNVKPFQGNGQNIVLGHGPHHPGPDGVLNAVHIFPSALSNKDVAQVARLAPTFAQPQQLSFSHAGDSAALQAAVRAGSAAELGLHGGSFTASLSLRRADVQKDSPRDTYTVIGTPRDDSFEIVVWNGSLGISLLGNRCVAHVKVPKEKWVRAAFAYNMRQQEVLIYQDSKLVEICRHFKPFNGTGESVWVGRSAPESEGGISGWLGELKDLQILNRSECIENLVGQDAKHTNDSVTARELLLSDAAAADEDAILQATIQEPDRSLMLLDDIAETDKAPSFSEGVAADFFVAVDENNDGVIDFGECAYRLEEATGQHPTTTRTTTATTTTATSTLLKSTTATSTLPNSTTATSTLPKSPATDGGSTVSTSRFPLSTRPAGLAGVVTISKNGTGAAELGTAGELGLTNSFSLSLELFRDGAQLDSPKAAYTVLGAPRDNSFEALIFNGSLGVSFGDARCNSKAIVPKEQWVDALFTYDESSQELRIYQDGTPVDSCTGMAAFRDDGASLWLGKSSPEAGVLPWLGSLRGVRVKEGVQLPNSTTTSAAAPTAPGGTVSGTVRSRSGGTVGSHSWSTSTSLAPVATTTAVPTAAKTTEATTEAPSTATLAPSTTSLTTATDTSTTAADTSPLETTVPTEMTVAAAQPPAATSTAMLVEEPVTTAPLASTTAEQGSAEPPTLVMRVPPKPPTPAPPDTTVAATPPPTPAPMETTTTAIQSSTIPVPKLEFPGSPAPDSSESSPAFSLPKLPSMPKLNIPWLSPAPAEDATPEIAGPPMPSSEPTSAPTAPQPIWREVQRRLAEEPRVQSRLRGGEVLV
jgi:hypothetical protein